MELSKVVMGLASVVDEVARFGRVPDKSMNVFDGHRFEFQFENGWGASIIRHSGSYGGRQGRWELAVLDSTGEIRMDTPITGDVVGWLTEPEVLTLLDNIELLAPEGTEIVKGELADEIEQ